MSTSREQQLQPHPLYFRKKLTLKLSIQALGQGMPSSVAIGTGIIPLVKI